ncbi:AMP deaminase 2-like [Elysia marginata]|uniref:AMP deaminase 2-like n=1 Tax=Elysia marginata TaxID=1093978 RepID=A0AAV4GS59_9GAST|nr:AMP deaminase 2-like [Elysia marginata]
MTHRKHLKDKINQAQVQEKKQQLELQAMSLDSKQSIGYTQSLILSMASNDHLNNCKVDQTDGMKRRSSDGNNHSPPFSPTHAKLPRHFPNADLDEELMKAGESLHQSVLSEDSAPARFELPRYPIQEKENREYFERQLSHRKKLDEANDQNFLLKYKFYFPPPDSMLVISVPANSQSHATQPYSLEQSGNTALSGAQHNAASERPPGKQRSLSHSGSGGGSGGLGGVQNHGSCKEAAHLLRTDSIIPREVATELEEELDMLPDFQRISISGEDTSGVPFKDLQVASKMLVRALMLREKYMILSGQTFPQVTGRFLASLDGDEAFDAISANLSKVTSLEGKAVDFGQAGLEKNDQISH